MLITLTIPILHMFAFTFEIVKKIHISHILISPHDTIGLMDGKTQQAMNDEFTPIRSLAFL